MSRSVLPSRARSSALLAAFLVTGLAQPARAEPPAPSPEPPAASAAESAHEQARRTGEPVEVAERTTETTQVVANPNGTFTLRSTARPTRVQRDGAWRDIDLTLRERPDGTLAPVASTADISFSGGGTAPVITFAADDKALALSWPTELPEPAVEGNTAVYRDVLPGVDLRVAADVGSFSQVLVVRDAEAARNPALAGLTLTAQPTGMTLDVAPDGTLAARDAEGEEVFHGSTPIMWDSSQGQHGDRATATDPGSGRVTPLKVSAEPAENRSHGAVDVTVVPDKTALTGPDVTYPVYIDPFMSRNKEAWVEVTSNGWHYFNNAMDAQVGRCEWNGCGSPAWVARSYFRMVTDDLMPRNGLKPVLFDAYFHAVQKHGAHGCTAEPVELKTGGWVDQNTRWPGPESGWVDTQHSAAGGDCGGAGTVRFNAKSGVQSAIDNNWNRLTMLLRSPDEGNKYQWKRFDNNPLLEATFSYRPNQPGGLGVEGAVACRGGLVSPTATPTLHTSATDNNQPPLNVGLWYEVWDSVGSARHANTSSAVVVPSGARAGWAATPRLADGQYAYRTAVENVFPGDSSKNLWSEPFWSPWLWFSVRSAPLTAAPKVLDSVDHPRDNWGAQSAAPGTITVEDFDNDNVLGFSYTFVGSGTEVAPGTTDCDHDRVFGLSGGWVSSTGRATIQLPAGLTPGYHTMHVKSFDDAHKMSVESQPYSFYVAPDTGGGATRIEAESLTVVQPAGQDRPVTRQADDCCGQAWSGDAQVLLGSDAVGQSFDFPFTVPDTGDPTGAEYVIGAGITSAPDYGRIAYFLDGDAVGQDDPATTVGPIDNHDSGVSAEHRHLATRRMTPGTHTLTLKVAGTNTASTGPRYHAGLDYISLATTGRYETEQATQVTATAPAGQAAKPLVVNQYCCSGTYSDGRSVILDARGPGESFDLTFRVPIEADYAVAAGLTKSDDAAKLEIALDGAPVARTREVPWNGYTTAGPATHHTPLGGAHLTPGVHTLTFKVVGKDPGADYHEVGVDYITAIPVNDVTTASFSAAMNNDGIVAAGARGNLDLAGAGLSEASLAAVGLAPGATKVVNGAAFTMPLPRADGADNVVAIGQTIPLATPVRSDALGLLVTSTCGNTPAATMTVTHTDGTTQNPTVPAVVDWAYGPVESALFVLPHRTVGTGTQQAIKPRLYALSIPVDPTKALKSVTLPNYGTSLMPGCPRAALHVLSMAPRPVASGWVGAWSGPADAAVVPPSGGFKDKTLRTVVQTSATGTSVRVKLANPYATEAMTVGAASVGAQATGAQTLAVPTPLAFGGSGTVTIPAGGEVLSDPVAHPATAGGSGRLVVSLSFTSAVVRAPAHNYATASTYLALGDQTAQPGATPFTTRLSAVHYLAGVEVSTDNAAHGTVVVLGDQFSARGGGDGGSWVDRLPAALVAEGDSVPGGLVNASRSGLPPTGWWKLNDGSGGTAANSVSSSVPVTFSSSVGWSTERGGAAVFNGTDGHGATATTVADTTRSYSASAWVKLSSTSAHYTAVSQGGANAAGYYLQYNKTFDGWAFISPSQDATNPTGFVSVVGPQPTLNTWTHLVGTFDGATGEMALYVDGRLIGKTANPTPFNAGGPLAIGGVKLLNGTVSNQFPGSISDVRVYRGVATAEDVAGLFKTPHGSVTSTTFGINAARTATAAATLDRAVLNQPNVRTVVIALGANDVLAGAGKDQIMGQIRDVVHPTSATGLRNVRRSDGSLVHVIVSTVAPMGLPTDDPREVQRRQFNDALRSGYANLGADGLLDLEGMVADASAPNRIASNLVTNGVPNNSFHSTVAQAVAIAVTGFPPLEL